VTIVAAVDIGTNSTKLLVTGDGTRTFRIVDTRLGQDLAARGRFHPDAIARTLATLAEYRSLAAAAGAERLVAVATSACRDAADREDFLDAAAESLGVRPVVISGDDEARLAYRGAMSDLPAGVGSPRLLIDIGGGSTEFVVGTDSFEAACSVDVGSVRLTEAELASDPPRPEELTNAIGLVLDHLDDVIRELPSVLDVAAIVGIGGTITTVAAVEIGASSPPGLHGFELRRDAVEDVFRTLATERLADRIHNPGLPTSRAGVIVGGLCVLVAVMRRLQADHLIVSQRTLVDGVCAELLDDITWVPSGGRV
jgi:exopolyphosphatase/guanosine-5'-triphosphate,3'-diphosphate pyrophosphatase